MVHSEGNAWCYRSVVTVLTAVLVSVQLQIWVLPQGYRTTLALQDAVRAQLVQNQILHQRNQRLLEEVEIIRHDPEALEYYARHELGMIKAGESFYRFH